MSTKTHILKKRMIDALINSLGVVAQACKKVQPDTWTTLNRRHYEWLKDDDDYKTKVEGIKEIAIDSVESNLHEQIKEGNTTATIFYLKTQAKKRGYIEKQEIEHQGGISIEPKEWV